MSRDVGLGRMGTMISRNVIVSGLVFPEAPRWHNDRLYFSDVHDERFAVVNRRGMVRTVARLEGRPAGSGCLSDGRWLIVSMTDRLILTADGEVWADLSDLADYDINDMVIDQLDCAYVSQVGFDFHAGGEPEPTPILLVSAEGVAVPTGPPLMVANGMCITPDGSTLLAAETLADRIIGFEIDRESGDLLSPYIWAELEQGASPDGICLDAELALWVAAPGFQAVWRVHEGGAISDEVVFNEPDRRALACMLGGPDGRSLFLCTAGPRRSIDETIAARAGRIEEVVVDVPGAGRP